jgi:hypothetical protein
MKQLFTTALAVVAVALSAQTTNVTFQVDMNDYTGSFTTPEVNGTFNSWCGNCNAMSDPDGDDIWTVTLPLATGSTIEYKFSHDAWTGQEQNDPTASCTNGNTVNTNRVLVVPAAAITLPAVCWGSCTPCTGTATTANITFRVDMSEFSGTFTTPEVNGTFNGWCGNCAPLTDADGDEVWERTVNLSIGDTIEYKFSADNWGVQEQNDPNAPCTNGNATYTNRVWIVTADTTLPAVCWASCNVCGLSTEENTAALFTLTPNPSADVAVLNATEAGTVEVVNVAGAVVARQAVVAGENRIETSVLANGIYTVRWTNGRESSAARLAVRH